MNRLVITEMQIRGVSCIVTAFFTGNMLTELRFRPAEEKSLLGNIYVGHTDNISENIQAGFLTIEERIPCYYPLKEADTAIFANPVRHAPLRPGDDLLVQVCRDAMKGKMPCLTTNLNFTGKYLVLTTGKKGLGLSAKLSGEEKTRLKHWLSPELTGTFGLVVRTNAAEASKEEIFRELSYLRQRCQTVCERGKSRLPGSLLEAAEPFYLEALRDAYKSELEEIVVEGDALCEKISAYLKEFQPEDLSLLRPYHDKLLPLYKLYALERELEKLSAKKVWLKSGGYLVIEQTEAFVSVDVNSGKFSGKKKKEEAVRKINLEAAQEIARQLRLRNLSGMILIDFINMESEDHKQELFQVLEKQFRKDPVKTTAVDITKLNILEATRRKVRRPLAEDFSELLKYSNDC